MIEFVEWTGDLFAYLSVLPVIQHVYRGTGAIVRYSVARKVEITKIDPMRGKASGLSCVINSTQGFSPKPGNHKYKRTVVNY